MELVNHGGKCCGIKTIHALSFPPDFLLSARVYDGNTLSIYSSLRDYQRPSQSCYSGPAQKETAANRLIRFIECVAKHRPSHLIEVVTNSDQKKWWPVLTFLGFRKTSTFLNSNSNLKVTVWHLVIKDGLVVRKKPRASGKINKKGH